MKSCQNLFSVQESYCVSRYSYINDSMYMSINDNMYMSDEKYTLEKNKCMLTYNAYHNRCFGCDFFIII
jgi:hypothetical protein